MFISLLFFFSVARAEIPLELLQKTEERKGYLYQIFYEADASAVREDQLKILELAAAQKIPSDKFLVQCLWNFVSDYGAIKLKKPLPFNFASKVLIEWKKFIPIVPESAPQMDEIKSLKLANPRDIQIQTAYSLSREWSIQETEIIEHKIRTQPNHESRDYLLLKKAEIPADLVITLQYFAKGDAGVISSNNFFQTFLWGIKLEDLQYLAPDQRLKALNEIFTRCTSTQNPLRQFRSQLQPEYTVQYALAYRDWKTELDSLQKSLSPKKFYEYHLKDFEFQLIGNSNGVLSIKPNLMETPNDISKLDYLQRTWKLLVQTYNGKRIPPQETLVAFAFKTVNDLSPVDQGNFYKLHWDKRPEWQIPLIQNMLTDAKNCPGDLLDQNPDNDMLKFGM